MQQDLLLHNVPSPQRKRNSMNMMSIGDSVRSVNFVVKPTHNDVLLGRGVGTNRHAGNINFRQLVSQYVVSSCRLSAKCLAWSVGSMPC